MLVELSVFFPAFKGSFAAVESVLHVIKLIFYFDKKHHLNLSHYHFDIFFSMYFLY